ncbi:MAG TPA: hypothetical protein VFD73_18245 [Gemmatimonadales bacterium]|nr:hypothetical protein [Gemmatimonadales bacterium]
MPPALSLNSARGRWILAGSILGSAAVFLESTVVNVALPAIAGDFGLGGTFRKMRQQQQTLRPW